MAIIKDFFEDKMNMKYLNYTFIPKTSSAIEISKFWPIACMNVVCKIILELLSNKLAHTLPGMISPNQSIFVQGRNIYSKQYAEELVREFDQKATLRRACVSIDLQNAFDSICWKAIEATLHGMDFSNLFIKLIMESIKSALYFILVEGQP